MGIKETEIPLNADIKNRITVIGDQYNAASLKEAILRAMIMDRYFRFPDSTDLLKPWAISMRNITFKNQNGEFVVKYLDNFRDQAKEVIITTT